MTDFVRDLTTLPAGKSDARPLTGPAGQNVTAAEWNSVMQALYDVRTHLLRPMNGFRTAEDLGILTTNTGAQNSDAWDAAMAAISDINGGERWLFHGGRYEFSRRLVFSRRVALEGVSALDSYSATHFVYRDGCGGGILAASYSETSDGGSGSTGSARNIIFTGPGNTLAGHINDGACGATVHTVFTLDHCAFEAWFDGVSVNASVGVNTNANGSQFLGVYCSNNERHGFFTHNTDANAMLFQGCSANQNGNIVGGGAFGWGFYEDSFLGNTYVACQADSNYGAGVDGLGNTGGGYYCHQAVNRSLFVGCYAEGGQRVDINSPAQWIGGPHDGDYQFQGSALCILDRTIKNSPLDIWFKDVGGGPGDRTGAVSVGGGNSENIFFQLKAPAGDGGVSLYDVYNGGLYDRAFTFGATPSPGHPAYAIGMAGAVQQAWPMAMPAHRVFFSEGVWLGRSRLEVVSSTPVTDSGEICNQGDVFIDRDRTDDYLGWLCSVSGTFGSYVEGLTATAAGGTSFTLSGASTVLKVGDYLSVGDAYSHHVTAIAGAAVTTAGPALPSGSGLAISYYAPSFTKFGPVTGFVSVAGSAGAATQNTRSGIVKIAAGASSVVITNSRITSANALVLPVLKQVDATLTALLSAVTDGTAHTITITGNANATADTLIGWTLIE